MNLICTVIRLLGKNSHKVLNGSGGNQDHPASRATDHNGQRETDPAGPNLFALVAPEDRDRLPAWLVDAYPSRSSYHNLDSLRFASVFNETRFRDAVLPVMVEDLRSLDGRAKEFTEFAGKVDYGALIIEQTGDVQP